MHLMDQALFDKVIQGVSDGPTLGAVLDLYGATHGAFYRYLYQNPINGQAYARARECQAETRAEECITIADTDPDAQRARNRIQTRQWHAGKMAPKRFGEKLDLTVTDTVNPALLHAEGLERVRRMRDPMRAQLAQPIENAALVLLAPTDSESAAPASADIWS